MKNPELAIDAILSEGEQGFVKRLTLARMALLEKIDSPILEGEIPDRMQTMELLYVMTAPKEELVKMQGDADKIRSAAFEWGDDLTDFSRLREWMEEVFRELTDLSKITPKTSGEDGKKKAATGG